MGDRAVRSHKIFILLLILAISISLISGFSQSASAAPTLKIQICHIPPGNTDNPLTLRVGAPSVPAHIAHGDLFGSCDDKFASLTIIKNVVNDDDGTNVPSDFTMIISAQNPSNNNFPGSSTGTTITIDAGDYSVSETGPGDYTASFSPECSGTAAADATLTCTITNNDDGPVENIRRLQEDNQLYWAMSKRGKKAIKKKYNREELARKMLEIIEDYLGGRD